MNSAVRPSFKEKFTEKSIYRSREQCTEPIEKTQTRGLPLPKPSLILN